LQVHFVEVDGRVHLELENALVQSCTPGNTPQSQIQGGALINALRSMGFATIVATVKGLNLAGSGTSVSIHCVAIVADRGSRLHHHPVATELHAD
jgi:hypothetical protein